MSKKTYKWSVVVLVAIVVFLGWWLYGRGKIEEPEIVNVPIVTVPTVTVPEGWHLFTDDVRGFSIAYPLAVDSGVNAEDQVTLPIAVKNKERTLHIEVSNPMKIELDADGCLKSQGQTPSTKSARTVNGVKFCVSSLDEGAAGSTYRTYHYVTKLAQVIDVQMTVRFPTSVKIYGGCETDAELNSETCKSLAFNEKADIQLFEDVLQTFNAK